MSNNNATWPAGSPQASNTPGPLDNQPTGMTGPQFTAHWTSPQPPSAPYSIPSQALPPAASNSVAAQPTAAIPAAKRRSSLAGFVAVALLAGGVGGAGGVAATVALMSGNTASSTASTQVQESAISTGTTTTVVQGNPTNPDWAAVAEAASKAVVAIQIEGQNGSAAQGSGVIVDKAGNIVTNNHVVSSSGNAKITVSLGDKTYQATVVGTDPSTDLAVIRLTDPPSTLSVMSYGDNTKLKVGDPVMAIGNPLGLSDTVTTGIVSALNRPVTTQAITNSTVSTSANNVVVTAAIQTNAAINPGNSGGALVNSSGQLIGITSSIASLPSSSSSQSGNIGIGFAIGADQVRYIADQLITQGTAQHPQIGVTAEDVNGTGQQGAVIATVTDGSPAAKAGLKKGDLVTSVNGSPVTSVEQLVALVRAGQVGKEMTLTIVRNSSEESVTVTPVAAKG